MADIEELAKRVEMLEKLMDAAHQSALDDFSSEQMAQAKFMAVFSFVQEIAEHEGISIEEFHKHYEIRLRFWHQYFLQKVEDGAPTLAATLDTRPIADCDTSDSYPPLFGLPPSEQK